MESTLASAYRFHEVQHNARSAATHNKKWSIASTSPFSGQGTVSAYDRCATLRGETQFRLPLHCSRFQEPSPMTMEPGLESLLAKYPVVIALPVFWGDQDAFGHVNNNAYFRWFESARIAYSQRIGLLDLFKAERIGPILASISCDYRRQLNFPDTVHVGIRVTRIGRTSLGLEHVIVSQSQSAVAAEGTLDDRRFRLSRQQAASRSSFDSPGHRGPGDDSLHRNVTGRPLTTVPTASIWPLLVASRSPFSLSANRPGCRFDSVGAGCACVATNRDGC